MATERQLQFRVGLLVLVSLGIGGWLVVQFGDLKQLLHKRYVLAIHFDSGSGLYPTAPVTLTGLTVGTVRAVQLDEKRGGVVATIEVREEIRIPVDSKAIIIRSILGETVVEITPGRERDLLKPGGRIEGQLAVDPLEMVQRMEGRAVEVLTALGETTREWQLVAKNVNGLMETNRGNLGQVVERAAESLYEFTSTMKHANELLASANKVVGNPAAQQALQETLIAMPKLVNETQRTIAETRNAVASSRQVLDSVNKNLVNLTQVTEPIGKRGDQMVAKLDSSLTNLDQLLGEMNRFAKLVNTKDGSLQKFASDPSLYDNLDRSSQSLAVLLRNIEPVLRDMREFSDKVARNPELLGVGGAVRPSAGLKDTELLNPQKPSVARGNNGPTR
ncbi:MAG: MlaD family protein [Planctomycetales bacterium]|nr:MlaD family protein [Planctomycetales bacterium]